MKKKMFSLTPKQILQVVAPLVIITAYIISSFVLISNKFITRNIIMLVADMTEKVETNVRITFETPTFAIKTLAQNVAMDTDKDYIRSLLKSTAAQYPQTACFFFATADSSSRGGYYMTSDDWRVPVGYEHTVRPWYTGAVAARGEVFPGEPYINTRSNKWCLTFAMAVYNDSNEFLGVAGCDIFLENLSNIVSKIAVSPNAVVNILDPTGLYLTNKDQSAIMKKSYFEDTTLKNFSASQYLSGEDRSFIKGDHFYALKQLGASPWFAAIEGPVSDFNGEFKKILFCLILIVIVLIVCCVLFNASIASKTNAKESKVSEHLVAETQNLVVAAKENAATSQDQSAAVKEIVATMEDNTALSENISQKIKGVSDVAQKTNHDVVEGVAYLEENVKQLQDIAAANQNTITGIKALGEKIVNIWDIVTLINSVADQAKIIAFNAELEASSAGEAGRNFHIVATEIRRLADGIIDGTKEIKERINEIQQSSDSLILASESGTEKINEGCENAKNLEERFASIKNASEITASSSGDITTIIQQQSVASEQILITLKQISAGIENFSAATENISQASQNLKVLASELGNKQITEEEA